MILLMKLLQKRILLVMLTVCISIFYIIVSLWWNEQLSSIIDIIHAKASVSAGTVMMAAVTILLSAGMAYLQGLCSGWTCENLAHDLRMGYAEHFTALSVSQVEELNAGKQLSILQNEIADISGFLRSSLFTFADDLIKFIGTFFWMLWLNPRLTVLSNLPTVFIIGYTVYSSKVIGRFAQESQQANAAMNGFADTLITIFPVLRLFDANPLIQEKYDGALEEWKRASILEERKRAKLMSLSALLSCIPLLLLLFIGGSQVIHGSTTVGDLYIFINLSGNVSGVMMNMPGRIALFRRFLANLKRAEPYVSIDTGRGKNEYLY